MRGSPHKDEEERDRQRKTGRDGEVGDQSCERVVMVTGDHDEDESDRRRLLE